MHMYITLVSLLEIGNSMVITNDVANNETNFDGKSESIICHNDCITTSVENMTDATGNEINSCGMYTYTLLNHNYQGYGLCTA